MPDASVDLVADFACLLERVVCWVSEVPVFVAFAGVDGAGVSAAHGDDDVGCADDIVGERLEECGSIPASHMTSTARGCSASLGVGPAERTGRWGLDHAQRV